MVINVLICEDDEELRNYYQLFVKQYINDNPDTKIRISLSTSNPRDLEVYMKNHPSDLKLYILDIEFPNSKIRGIDLATKIRMTDLNAKIVFITTHEELSTMTFDRKIEPLDYISKELGLKEIQRRLQSDIDIAVQRISSLDKNDDTNNFIFNIGPKPYSIPLNDIDYFDVSDKAHNVLLHTSDEIIEFPSSLTDIDKKYKCFYRIHKSLLMNLQNFASIDSKRKLVQFKDGLHCDISRRRIYTLKKLLNEI